MSDRPRAAAVVGRGLVDPAASLVARTAGLSLSRRDDDVQARAAAEASKQRARQHRKYHSKRGAQKVGGRHKGSKAKQDTRVKPDRGGFWD